MRELNKSFNTQIEEEIWFSQTLLDILVILEFHIMSLLEHLAHLSL